MNVRFFKDHFNARFCWSWINGEFVTADTVIIENYKGLGLRWENVEDDGGEIGRREDGIGNDNAQAESIVEGDGAAHGEDGQEVKAPVKRGRKPK